MQTERAVPTVSSNGVPVPFDSEHFAPLADSTPLLDDPAALVERYRHDGYLLLRRVLDPERVEAVRRAYFTSFGPGYLRAGTDPADGIFSGWRPEGLAAHGTAGHPAHDFVRSAEFLDFCARPELTAIAETVLEGPVRQLPRRILRHFDRSRPAASRAHTDYTYLDAGSDHLVTAWIPLGDCPLPTGGLIYLEGSHHLGDDELESLRVRSDRVGDRRPLSHDLAWVAERTGRRWLWTDYGIGDVVLHSPHVVHASLDVTTDRMRLSADLRWLAEGAEADPRWSSAWAGDDGK
jgi:ectoine hydroxylase-related dioxygenase (phytanoyl-CoA dioxygenase family)